jgi:hypothetical protein
MSDIDKFSFTKTILRNTHILVLKFIKVKSDYYLWNSSTKLVTAVKILLA